MQAVKVIYHGVFLENGEKFSENSSIPAGEAAKNTIAYRILQQHNTSGDSENLKIKFDAMASHDITYVGIIQTARASGFDKFPIPYVLTNCHNSLCAVGGTINEDDHVFGLSAAIKYGGIFVPAHQSVIHSYMREMMSGCGKMILGSDSHTRYGALGTLAIGEGGPELVKQLLCRTYDIARPPVVAVRLTGSPRPGVGPHDVAIALIGAVFKSGIVKNKVLEFVGSGIKNLPIEFRNGIDVMTTETSCLSSVWVTDDQTRHYFELHKRPSDFKYLAPGDTAYYDCAVDIDLSKIESMIALPFHPSNAVTIRELCADPEKYLNNGEIDLRDKLTPDGHIKVEQGVIAGCAGGIYDNLCAAADILRGKSVGCGEFGLSVYPASQPVLSQLLKNGVAEQLITAGAIMRTAFCGPCFGAGDVPSNGGLSIRHSTRNFPNREGSKPSGGQSAYVALMDARSIAATAANGGILTAADTIDVKYGDYPYTFDDSAYVNRVYNGFGRPDSAHELKIGPNIADWPAQKPLGDHVIMPVVSIIDDPVTTTDELIPSGETSSYRSNPLKLAEFALSRKDPAYVARAKDVMKNDIPENVMAAARSIAPDGTIEKGSMIYANRPGDGSAREQAASCQRVLGGLANLCIEYATKRYRSNLINWGMLPLNCDCTEIPVALGDCLFVPDVRKAVESGAQTLDGYVISPDAKTKRITLKLPPLTRDERDIILAGCLINYYKTH